MANYGEHFKCNLQNKFKTTTGSHENASSANMSANTSAIRVQLLAQILVQWLKLGAFGIYFI